jgi:hypothetical protein
MASESVRERRQRLDAITEHVRDGRVTAEDVSWLCRIADEYVSAWEQTIARSKRRAERKRDARWNPDE